LINLVHPARIAQGNLIESFGVQFGFPDCASHRVSPYGPQCRSAARRGASRLNCSNGTLTDAAFQATEANLTESIKARSSLISPV
jgi:hypothetical protein